MYTVLNSLYFSSNRRSGIQKCIRRDQSPWVGVSPRQKRETNVYGMPSECRILHIFPEGGVKTFVDFTSVLPVDRYMMTDRTETSANILPNFALKWSTMVTDRCRLMTR